MGKHILKLAIVLAGLSATPALADCVDDLRQWHNEEIEGNAERMKAEQDLANGIGNSYDLDSPAAFCKSTQILARMYKHQAAYYRQCQPGLEGEDKAHNSEVKKLQAEQWLVLGHCPALRK